MEFHGQLRCLMVKRQNYLLQKLKTFLDGKKFKRRCKRQTIVKVWPKCHSSWRFANFVNGFTQLEMNLAWGMLSD